MASLSKGPSAPLTPVLLAGIAARPVPPKLLQPALSFALKRMHQQHRDVFERLSSVNSPRFLIDPIDLPFSFVLDTDAQAPSLKVISVHDDEKEFYVQASIRGALLSLIELLEGRIDGDALFFSRDLVVEGHTEAVLALRNAVDGSDINVHDDLLNSLGPLKSPADHALRTGSRLFNRLSADLDMVSQAVLGPLQRKCDAQAAHISELEETLSGLKKQLRRRSGKSA